MAKNKQKTEVSPGDIHMMVAAGETRFVDFKEHFYDLKTESGKGELIKDIIAMANTATLANPCYLLFGITDRSQDVSRSNSRSLSPHEIVGCKNTINKDAIAQILTANTLPAIAYEIGVIAVDDKEIVFIRIPFSKYRPHYTTRQIDKCRMHTAYIRYAATTGIMSVPDLEIMIREKLNLLGPINDTPPLRIGFLNSLEWQNGCITCRIENISTEPIVDVHAFIDSVLFVPPHGRNRARLLNGIKLGPEESREAVFDVKKHPEYYHNVGKKEFITSDIGQTIHHWIHITLRVAYRDRYGYLRELSESLNVPH